MANNNYDRNRPKYEWGDSWMKKGITKKQAKYIAALVDRLAAKGHNVQVTKPLNELIRGEGSNLISELKDVSFYNSTRYLIRNCGSLVAVEQ